jgi:predicted regulator of Ras-like GTPase activity (Roadblock/LC7/MglB family)
MEYILKQINSVNGTIGSMVCDATGAVLAHAFPAQFEHGMLHTSAVAVCNLFAALKDMSGGVKMADLRYQNGRVVVKPVAGICLVVVCDHSVKMQLLSITLNVSTGKLENVAKGGRHAGISVSRPDTAADVSPRNKQQFFENGLLSSDFEFMQTALAKNLGPMAKIIFFECVEKWQQQNMPSKSTLPQLIEVVVQEIDDPARVADFRQRVAHLLN